MQYSNFPHKILNQFYTAAQNNIRDIERFLSNSVFLCTEAQHIFALGKIFIRKIRDSKTRGIKNTVAA